MSNLTDRLRADATLTNSYQSDPSAKPQDLITWEAADRIERLEKGISKQRLVDIICTQRKQITDLYAELKYYRTWSNRISF